MRNFKSNACERSYGERSYGERSYMGDIDSAIEIEYALIFQTLRTLPDPMGFVIGEIKKGGKTRRVWEEVKQELKQQDWYKRMPKPKKVRWL